MRLSSTYHLYKIALLITPSNAAKDSVIVRAGEISKALYFVISGSVEVIQARLEFVHAAVLCLCYCMSSSAREQPASFIQGLNWPYRYSKAR